MDSFEFSDGHPFDSNIIGSNIYPSFSNFNDDCGIDNFQMPLDFLPHNPHENFHFDSNFSFHHGDHHPFHHQNHQLPFEQPSFLPHETQTHQNLSILPNNFFSLENNCNCQANEMCPCGLPLANNNSNSLNCLNIDHNFGSMMCQNDDLSPIVLRNNSLCSLSNGGESWCHRQKPNCLFRNLSNNCCPNITKNPMCVAVTAFFMVNNNQNEECCC